MAHPQHGHRTVSVVHLIDDTVAADPDTMKTGKTGELFGAHRAGRFGERVELREHALLELASQAQPASG